jgi:hypothetical protein
MPFIISALGDEGAVSVQRDTAAGAMEKPVQLSAEGKRDVIITDPKGQLYPAKEFERLFLQDGD